MDYFNGAFDIGVSLHACGVATDLVIQKCIKNSASFVSCPCCYGSVQENHMVTYPRSQEFREAPISFKVSSNSLVPIQTYKVHTRSEPGKKTRYVIQHFKCLVSYLI